MERQAVGYHLECPSGLAGDMFLGACLDLGLPLDVLSDAVSSLSLDGVSLEARRALRGGIGGVRFRVLVGGEPIEGPDPEEMDAASRESLPPGPAAAVGGSAGTGEISAGGSDHSGVHRDYRSIRRLIRNSGLEPAVRERSLELFARLAEVEGGIHGVPVDDVHFHEVGAIDSIVDLVGACAAVEAMSMDSLTCGTIVVGSGTARTEHGLVPVPAPATAELIRGVPTSGGGTGELLTPTGALLIQLLSAGFGPQPEMTVEAIGYGLGRWQLSDRANACRIVRGRPTALPHELPVVVQIETQVDDLSAETLGHAMSRLFEAGCLDAFFAPVQMKKNRPGTLITVLAREAEAQRLARVLLRQTGSLGCRFLRLGRLEAVRKVVTVETEHGPIRVKQGLLDGELYVVAPEYEDCARLAVEKDLPLRVVIDGARFAAERESSAFSTTSPASGQTE